MKRFYSHYTFIYPASYLQNVIVELDSEKYIVSCFPFEGEIEKTEFHSGLLLFIPLLFSFESAIENLTKQEEDAFKSISSSFIAPSFACMVYNEQGFLINR